MAGGIVKGAIKGVSKAISKGGRKATKKAAWETGEQFFKRMDKDGVVPEILSDITRSDMIEQINIQQGSDNEALADMFRGYADGNTDAHQAVMDYTTTLSGASHYQQNYTRLDAAHNLREAGADRLSNMKRKRRTIQGPVPPQLADKTFDQGARSYEEAVMLGTTKYIDDSGVAQQIRNYGSPTAPHGRVTKVDVRKMSGRGTEGRITWEKILTIDKKAKGFYGVKVKGHEHAHHWNPIGVMKRVVEGLDPKLRDQLISEAQDEFGLYSGNTMFNLRQLPTTVHDKLHKALNKAGYDPKKMQSFAKADYATRKAFLKEFSKVLNDLDQQVFGEVMIAKHGPDWASKFKGLQVE